MNREKQRVLEMVADGTITAAEGVKLLEALESTRRTSGRSKKTEKNGYSDASSILSSIGPMVQSALGSVFKSRKSFEAWGDTDLEEVASVSEVMDSGTDIVIHGDSDRGKSVSISLLRSEDNTLRASVDNNSTIKTGNRNNSRIMLCTGGELTVHVPDSAGSVKVLTKGGGISSSDVQVPVELKTMGGGVNIARPGNNFSIKTMGGGLSITLDSNWKGNSKAKTMGGGVSVVITDDTDVLISASTLGGAISVGGKDPEILTRSEGAGKSKISVRYGDSHNSSKLSVVSMGGGIVIKGDTDE